MKSRLMRLAGAAALAAMTAAAATPALAGGPRGGGGYYGGHGGHGGYYSGHGGYYGGHRGGHGHSSGWSSTDTWIVGGALALVTAGLLLSANSQPSYAPTVQAGGDGYMYTSPGYNTALTQTPSYAPPPPVYEPAPMADPADPASANLAPVAVAQAAPPAGQADCGRYAMNQSGFDPANAGPWTTQVMVDTYNRALQTCRDNNWGG
ncbi:hypothetical protein [Bordetella pseudohinzii]|uniref:Lipoprotein n=2 Tax=Bordetella pseudohinzii TaxID=1331258 RepID=A0A0J6CA43_9BORD|nr:hypothetical protein [Bordetella pseudohinzii]ANY16443.1 hypothetical protein BBN53_11380 [Bordetella pseudohinzii]KMM27586.1 hypothetical protein L540_00895 [Bordetella pseudohinzii]KXA78171.1 hypothetical protein AW877_12260 [Bordetella pseudohinzii]KXA82049.1 hypothetical protein AW878_01995 [Bordetella pseudohinzii]CUI36662.1 Uncharacterised protein [Bordetella pseudohinzii]